MKKKIIGIIVKKNIINNKNVFTIMKEFSEISDYFDVVCLGIIPINNKKKFIKSLNLYDGFILQGGTEGYKYEKIVLEYAINVDKPILGICMGMQLMASLYKDNIKIIDNKKYNNHNSSNKYVHEIIIDKNSNFYKFVNKEKIKVNSSHFEHVINPGIYKVSAYSNDGIIEIIEYNKNKFNIGVQFHPERLLNDKNMIKIFECFISNL